MDPMQASRQFYEQMESFFIQGMERMVRDPASVGSMSRAVEGGLETKARADAALKQYLESMQIPTRDDVAKILQCQQTLESRILGLEEKIEDLADLVRERLPEKKRAGRK